LDSPKSVGKENLRIAEEWLKLALSDESRK